MKLKRLVVASLSPLFAAPTLAQHATQNQQPTTQQQPTPPDAAATRILDETIEVDTFELPAGDTLIIRGTMAISATGPIIIRGTVRVEPPPDAPPGTSAPWLYLRSETGILLLGEMHFADGLDAQGLLRRGGNGASLSLLAPFAAIHPPEIRLGNGGNGGASGTGGGGGVFQSVGTWLIPTHEDGCEIHAGNGGRGGDAAGQDPVNKSGLPGGQGGMGGSLTSAGIIPWDRRNIEPFMLELAEDDPRVTPFLGADRRPPNPLSGHGGDGGRGGDGADAARTPQLQTGGNGGDGGPGGFAQMPDGLPGQNATANSDRGRGGNGASAFGGDGGDGGNAGFGGNLFGELRSGDGGNGGDASAGAGGRAGLPFNHDTKQPGEHTESKLDGQNGRAIGGSGGNAGTGHAPGAGGDGGKAYTRSRTT